MSSVVTAEKMKSTLPKWRAYRLIREQIDSGALVPGERVPGEEHLASDLGVSRMTVRAALGVLEDEGMIDARGRKGRFVAAETKTSVSQIFSQSIILVSSRREIVDPSCDNGYLHAVDSGIIHGADDAEQPFMILPQSQFERFGYRGLVEMGALGIAVTETLDVSATLLRELKQAREAGLPVVVSNYRPGLECFDRVLSDHREGAREIVDYLVKQGAKTILHVLPGAEHASWVEQRLEGAHEVMASAGLAAPTDLLFRFNCIVPPNAVSFEDQARRFAGILVEYLSGANKVDAIMTTNDGHAYHIAKACELFGIIPGKDILIAGYDNTWENCPENEFIDFKPTATVDKLNHQLGMKMFDVMLARSRGELGPKAQEIMCKPKFIIP